MKIDRVEIDRKQLTEMREMMREMRDSYDIARGSFDQLPFSQADWTKRCRIIELLKATREMYDGGTGRGIYSIPKKAWQLYESL
jgi:hypothetical protein